MKKTKSTTCCAVLHESKLIQNIIKQKSESSQLFIKAADECTQLQKACTDTEFTHPSYTMSRPGRMFMPNASHSAVPLTVLSATTHLTPGLVLLP